MATPARTFGYLFGAVYLLVGIVGFPVTGFDDFASTARDEQLLGIFALNPLHNVVHLLIGVALLAGAAAGEITARAIAMLVGAVYAVVGILGFFIVDNESLNILALNHADNLLHVGTAAIAFVAVAASRRPTATTTTAV